MSNLPKVSIGIPTYNRPDGLLRTLKQITAQTYPHLEILVSNNASTNPMVRAVLDRCAELDPRIRAVHQPENLGIVRNFKYVLQHSTSDYFMWAADDDEWDVRFVERCMEGHATHDVALVMPGFLRHNRALDAKAVATLPKMTGADRHADAMAFYQALPHSMYYGIHKRRLLDWYLEEPVEANDDEYLILRQILDHGVLTLPEHVLYLAGIDDAQYQIKIPKEAPDRYFYQVRRLLRYAELIDGCPQLSDVQRMQLLQTVVLTKLRFVLSFEQGLRDPAQLALARTVFDFIGELDMAHLDVFTRLIRDAKAHVARVQAQQAAA